ncbi:DDB1- and CUL4-associated factor 5 isoform X2 [Tachyglossus aculeatus]|uniref:DDB1- and CUL4-associated factor 5 isoform X2 n=1 Tax=Tachyglossus aculeatus TaxID=9261 RepID=UPI0018F3124E|nr:DDB1- and CUL4-associated factor 5 isoform X2 [Tachyglossus aculeatus]
MRSVVGFLSQRCLRGDPLLTQDFQRSRLRGCRNLYKKDLLGHFGCVNAIEFSNNGGQWLVSGGDDRRVLLWHMEQAIHSKVKPIQLKGEHHSNIFCLAFNSGNTKVFSGGNDEQVILHDVESSETLDVFAHEDAVYGLSVSPVNDNVFASSSDDGRVLIWDIRESPHGEPFCLANYPSAFHSVMFNPVEPRLLATANSKEGVGLWDIRKPQSSLLRYGGNLSLQSAMSVRFNSNGSQLLALRRRLPPVLYDIHSRLPVFQFDNQGYFNSCTMKSCCFAGDRDQYILSGSDDFNLYMWRIPPDPEADLEPVQAAGLQRRPGRAHRRRLPLPVHPRGVHQPGPQQRQRPVPRLRQPVGPGGPAHDGLLRLAGAPRDRGLELGLGQRPERERHPAAPRRRQRALGLQRLVVPALAPRRPRGGGGRGGGRGSRRPAGPAGLTAPGPGGRGLPAAAAGRPAALPGQAPTGAVQRVGLRRARARGGAGHGPVPPAPLAQPRGPRLEQHRRRRRGRRRQQHGGRGGAQRTPGLHPPAQRPTPSAEAPRPGRSARGLGPARLRGRRQLRLPADPGGRPVLSLLLLLFLVLLVLLLAGLVPGAQPLRGGVPPGPGVPVLRRGVGGAEDLQGLQVAPLFLHLLLGRRQRRRDLPDGRGRRRGGRGGRGGWDARAEQGGEPPGPSASQAGRGSGRGRPGRPPRGGPWRRRPQGRRPERRARRRAGPSRRRPPAAAGGAGRGRVPRPRRPARARGALLRGQEAQRQSTLQGVRGPGGGAAAVATAALPGAPQGLLLHPRDPRWPPAEDPG